MHAHGCILFLFPADMRCVCALFPLPPSPKFSTCLASILSHLTSPLISVDRPPLSHIILSPLFFPRPHSSTALCACVYRPVCRPPPPPPHPYAHTPSRRRGKDRESQQWSSSAASFPIVRAYLQRKERTPTHARTYQGALSSLTVSLFRFRRSSNVSAFIGMRGAAEVERERLPNPAEGDVDSLYEDGTEAGTAKQRSTVSTTTLFLALPWLACTVFLVAVLIYVNVHTFSVWRKLVSMPVGAGANVSVQHRDTARYTVLPVSLVLVAVHLAVSFCLFRRAYHVLWDVQMSLVELSFMVEVIRAHQHSTFFFVDCVERAQRVRESMRYWVKEFSDFKEICAAELAVNQVTLRLMTRSTESAQRPGSPGDTQLPRTDSGTSSPPQLTRGGRLPPDTTATAFRLPQDATWSPHAQSVRTDSAHADLGPGRQLAGHQSGSHRSLSVTTEIGITQMPFQVTLKRRHVALLLLSFLTYRELVRAEAVEARQISRDFIAAVNMCAQKYKGCIVELYSDRAILSWNAFFESAGNYAQACVQCGGYFHDRFVRRFSPESGAYFSTAGYTGHIVCGTTTEKSLLLHGQPVSMLRGLPTLLEMRYCAYVWLGTPPPACTSSPLFWTRIGTVQAGADFSVDLHAMRRTSTEPLPAAMVWHMPQWTTFGDERAVSAEVPTNDGAAQLQQDRETALVTPASTAASTGVSTAFPSFPSPASPLCLRGVGTPYETFYDRSHNRYQLSNMVLGESKSCVVRLAISETGNFVAVKEIKIERGDVKPIRRRRYQRENRIIVTGGEKPQWMNEVEIMERHRHTCIVAYISFVEAEDKLRIVMEYVGGGNLLKFTSSCCNAEGKGLPMAVLLRNVVEGLKFLHQKGIVHGDIKPQNVLVPDSGPCKIADFGISRRATTTVTSAIEGTPFYMSPEATRGEVTVACDIWSFGIMMAQMLTGRLPYDASVRDYYLVSQFMCNKDVKRELHTPLKKPALDVFLACTQYDPAKRKTAKELLKMPYFTNAASSTDDA
ncbi:protein kinase, putative [Leishmania tarentolae]|uniref:Protein kinase, putative n=1 Tax=Leishmania tarentolae TaxID=5689 RepID=A0A640KAV8_LEITA|nr:protein kinase, putative [Leishmania tarentolae]